MTRGKLDVDSLLSNREFYSWLIDSDLPAAVDITLVRDLSADKVRDPYMEALRNYLDDESAILKFVAMFDTEIRKYQHITFNIMPLGG